MATPLAAPDQLDVIGLEQLVRHILSGGVDGLFLLGTTGEGPSLSHKLRRELIERATTLANGKAPVLVAITDTSRAESVELAKYAADHGASAVVLAPPYYFPMTQSDLLGYVERLVPDLPLPVFLYNIPSHAKTNFEPGTVRKLAEISKIHGFKDSSGDLDYFRQVLEAVRDRPDFAVLMGPEELLTDAIGMGAHGGVNGGSNLMPGLFVKLYEAARDGNIAEASRLQQIVVRFGQGVYTAGSYPSGLKAALEVMGICSGVPAEPFRPLGSQERDQVRNALAEAGMRDLAHF